MANDRGEGARLVGIDDLRRCLAGAFERLQLTPEDAEGLGGLLVDSELRGHPDHGVAALGVLVRFYRDGTLNPRPRIRVLHETDGAILFDGDRGCGPGVPTRAMRWCTDLAEFLEGGLMAPLGYPHAPHKGFGLALLVDALSGVLSGAGFAQGVAGGAPGNFLWALDVEAVLPRQEFLARMEAQIDQIKQGERLPGVEELLVPGERGQRRATWTSPPAAWYRWRQRVGRS